MLLKRWKRCLTFAVSKEDGMVYSRCGDEIAYPVLQFGKIGEGGDFTQPFGDFTQPFEYQLEKSSVFSFSHCWPMLRWTRKIPVELKNLHRKFWGFKPLAG